MNVFCLNRREWVVADDAHDANIVWCETIGEVSPHADRDWVRVDDDAVMRIRLDSGELVEKTARQWVAEGRGYLGALDT